MGGGGQWKIHEGCITIPIASYRLYTDIMDDDARLWLGHMGMAYQWRPVVK